MVKGKKLLAMILVFTLSFSHFAIVTESIAATNFISLFGSNSENENVEFTAALKNGDTKQTSLASDVNNDDLAISLELDVKEAGYLKAGKIEITPKEEKEELNFKIKDDNQIAETEDVQSLENNVIMLNKINYSSDKMEISVPIEYDMEEYINDSKLLSTAKVTLSGVYVDNNGKENEISYETELTLAWKDERKANVSSEITKYVTFGKGGVILQTVIKVDSSNPDKNSLPVKSSKVTVDVPKLNEVVPSEVSVVANSTKGTNGNGVGDVQFSDKNWNYNKDENKINIEVENYKKEVEISDSKEFLKTEGTENKKEERYYSKADVDEYVITYTYQNLSVNDAINVVSDVAAEITVFSGVEADKNETVIKAEKQEEMVLEGETGNIISHTVENDKTEISKIYSYLNKEVEFTAKTNINVSYKDIVEEMMVEDLQNYYIDKSENIIQADDIYYKQISINKENFTNILGEDGTVKILDVSGNELATINKDMQEVDGNYVIDFQDKISKAIIKTSAPVNIGNLVITSKKAIAGASIEKAQYANAAYIASDSIQKAKFSYVSDVVELDQATTKLQLNDTVTDINLTVGDDLSLVTGAKNSNVELRIELGNNKETSDIYGNSVFEIEMPSYITKVDVTNASMIYGEGLEIAGVETYNRDGKNIIKVTVNGKQTEINSGELTNGSNIVLTTDLTVDMYTPSITEKIRAYGYNSEATNYANAKEYTIENVTVCASSKANVRYSAPNGVVAINAISNYENTGKTLASLKQGEKSDYIDIYAEAVNAKSDIVIMNNNDNTVSNLAILGRVPFAGVKDIESGEELGTTMDTKMVAGISSSQSNNAEFTIYYSENGEATADIENSKNAWVTNPESFENIKSYLIVPSDSEYKMEAKQILRFSYEYTIPENLNHNEYFYGTFQASYLNNTEVANLEETAKPDMVGLTTGVGPEISFDLSSKTKKVKELEEFEVVATVKNTGEDVVRDVVVNIPVPENTTFVSVEKDKDSATVTNENGKVTVNMQQLTKESSLEVKLKLKANEISAGDNNKISISASATAKDLGKELVQKLDDMEIKMAEMKIRSEVNSSFDRVYLKEGTDVTIIYYLSNTTDDEKTNTKFTVQLPKELTFTSAYTLGNIYANEDAQINNATYDETTNKVTWNLGNVEAHGLKYIRLNVKAGNLDAALTEKKCKITSQVSADNMDTYNGKDIEFSMGRASISVVQTTSTETYVNEGDVIEYAFTLKNEGPIAQDVVLTDSVPAGLIMTSASYKTDDNSEHTIGMSSTDKATVNVNVPAKSAVDVHMKAEAIQAGTAAEKSVVNVATVTTAEGTSIQSNNITHIVKSELADSDAIGDDDDEDTNKSDSDDSDSSKTQYEASKKYDISGIAWLDKNKDGIRDDDEERLEDITAMAIDSNTGVIKSTVKTNRNGEYTISGLKDGNYLVIFKYDTVKYTTTMYQKEGVETSLNSDAVTTKIELDGEKENGAVTDTIAISGSNAKNIDLGLAEADQFSMQLDKTITKITVQNAEGSKTEEFNKTKLAKYDIAAKYLSGTTVYVEYTITVTNNGDLPGFATEVVDYIPEGMTFNSNLNSAWYTGTDGNLYTKALENKELNKGESAEIKLVLTKKMTADNTGLVSNTAEIADDYNIYAVSDINSTPKNKAQGEDDMSNADVILTVKTGESLIYLSAIIVSVIIGGMVGIVVYNRIAIKRRRGGV